LFLLVDASGSMNCALSKSVCDDSDAATPGTTSRWSLLRQTIADFVAHPYNSGRAVGITVLPAAVPSSVCNPFAYEVPVVPIELLPGNAPAITAWLDQVAPVGATPMVSAVSGAIEHAGEYVRSHVDRAAAVVLMTDGEPAGCDDVLDASAAVANDGFNSLPTVRTFVVAVAHARELDQVALAGSGGVLRSFDATPDLAANLAPFLEAPSHSVTCNFAIRSMSSMPIDYGSALVTMTIGEDASSQVIPHVENAASCGPVGGWYYDVAPPQTPTIATLCPQSCEILQKADAGRVELTIACAAP
jgi:hypothetical protein